MSMFDLLIVYVCVFDTIVAKQRLINLDAEVIETHNERKAMEAQAAAAATAAATAAAAAAAASSTATAAASNTSTAASNSAPTMETAMEAT